MPSKDNDLNKYQKKSDREHILDNPDTYIGSVELIGVMFFFCSAIRSGPLDSRRTT